MSRKTTIVTISAEGRDQGNAYLITEMPASRAERWATRAIMALGRSGIEVPDEVAQAGMAAVAAMGIRAFTGMDFADAEPLLDEMFDCVQFMPDPKAPGVVRALIEDDIQEVATRLLLRSEVVALHVGFSIRDALSSLGELAKNRASRSSNTQTPPEPLEPSFPPDSPV